MNELFQYDDEPGSFQIDRNHEMSRMQGDETMDQLCFELRRKIQSTHGRFYQPSSIFDVLSAGRTMAEAISVGRKALHGDYGWVADELKSMDVKPTESGPMVLKRFYGNLIELAQDLIDNHPTTKNEPEDRRANLSSLISDRVHGAVQRSLTAIEGLNG